MPYYCTVPRCTSMAGKAKNVSFHQFPRDEELAKLWNKILKRGKPYTKYSKVCSLHFTPEDYTITSVGKNKGQWRTLRKDAIPSQNLPSESPTPYQRKQWSSWSRETPTNIMDPTIHHQVAQAIYMQTMLAMQAAGAPDLSAVKCNDTPAAPTEAFAHSSATSDTDILKGKQTNTHKSNSFKCTECSKCFKDPDVYILHKRGHVKNEKNEKENFNLNVTLQANPILANLLKTNTENTNIFDTNFSVESLLMTALAANMEGYMRNFASMVKGEDRGLLDHDNSHLDHNSHSNSESGRLDHDNSHLDHDNGHIDHDNGHLDHDNGHLDHDNGHLDHGSGHLNNDHVHSDSDHGDLNHDNDDRGRFNDNNDQRGLIKDCQSTSCVLDDSSLESNKNPLDHDDIDVNQDMNVTNSDTNVFSDRIVEHFRNSTFDSKRSVRYYENDVSNGSIPISDQGAMDQDRGEMGDDHMNGDGRVGTMNDRSAMDHYRSVADLTGGMVDHERGMVDHVKGMIDYDRGMMEHDRGVMNHDRGMLDRNRYNDDDSQGSSDEPFCDNDLNESIDSNKLIIDETV